MILIGLILLIVFSGTVYSEDLPDTVFPWGVYSARFSDESGERDSMHTVLGFNLVNLAWLRIDADIIAFMDDDMVVYPNASPKLNPPDDITNYFKYAEAFYTLVEAEDEDLTVRFRYHHPGGGTDDGFWFYEVQSEDTILDNLAWYHSKYNKVLDSSNPAIYHRSIRMKIDEFSGNPLDTTDILAILYCDMGAYGIDTTSILASEFYDGSGGFIDTALIIDCDEFTIDADRSVTYTLYSTGEAKLYIDYIKVPDQYGIDLIDVGYWDEKLIESAYYPFNHKRVAGWYLADEPHYEQFRSLAYIDNLIQAHDPSEVDIPRVVTALNRLYEDFVKMTDPEVIWTNIYGLHGGQQCRDSTGTLKVNWDFTDYTGSDSVLIGDVSHVGLQYRLNEISEKESMIHEICVDNGIDWWLMPQAFAARITYDNYDCNDSLAWRFPTKSEVKCCVNIGLCNDTKGIVLWRYHSSATCIGMRNLDGSKNPAYYAVEEMNPYIKAIWPTLIKLEHYSTHACSSSSQSFLTPNLVYSVTAYCDSTNPDLGWFHIGEFEDVGDTLYFMLVNRACNVDSTTLAPDVTCVVRLTPNTLGSDYACIIDIADTAYFDFDSLIVVSDTVYSSKLDGFIPYTTVLKAGEGRLFKVVPIDTIDFHSNFDDSYYYQGGYTFDSTLTIDSTKTLRLRAPARLQFAAGDTMIIKGGLFTTGCDSGLVEFAAAVDSTQWKGLLFTGSTAIGDLSFINIEDTYNHSIKISDSARVELQNSEISNSLFGVHIVNSGKLYVRDCSFEKGLYGADGIYNESGDSVEVIDCDFKNFTTSGILSCDGYLKVEGSEVENSSCYGIYIENGELSASGCNFSGIEYYGIYSYKSDMTVTGCDFDSIGIYGIYADSSEIC